MKFNKKTECLLYVLLGVFSGIIGSSIMIFIIYNFEDKKEFIKIVTSIVGLFTTFGGAYLGAKISGDNARNLEIDRQNREREETILRVKTLLKMNLDSFNILHNFICDFYCIKRREFLLDLIKKRKELYYDNYSSKQKRTGEFKTIKFIEDYITNFVKSLNYKRNIYYIIDDIDDLIKEITKDLKYFEEKELQIIFQLKQTLQILKSLISYNSKENVYTLPKVEEYKDYEHLKGHFMLFSILFIDLNEIILNIDLKTELEQSVDKGQVKGTDLG